MARRRRTALHFAICALALTAACPPAWAQASDEDKALALKLFDDGRALLESGKVDDACRKLEESLRLNALPGTLLNVAVCHEQQGRTASAVAEFREARDLAERDQRQDRVALADQHLQALAGKVSNLVIVVPREADRPDLTITRDGTAVGRAAWGTRIPVDPGAHVVEASAANKKPWKVALTLAPAEAASPPPAPPLAETAPPPPPPPQPAVENVSEHHALSTRRTLALVSAGVGVVGVGLGTYFGLSAISKHRDPAATCTIEPCTHADSLNHDAGTAADLSTVSFAVGLVGLGLGAFLWLGDTSGRSDKAAVTVTPAWGPRQGGINLRAAF
jgi:hypothetical protein